MQQSPLFRLAEDNVQNAVEWLRLGVESIGAAIVAAGVIATIVQFARATLRGEHHRYNTIRITLARYLAVALEFQLGADILSTAVAPSWDQIGKLAAIAVIRTLLNYFLSRELEAERSQLAASGP